MKLMEAAELATLRERAKPAVPRKTLKTAEELAQAIWAEAEERGIHGSLGGCSTWQQWQQRWLPSRAFRLVRLPLNAAALTCAPRETNLVLKKIHAREESPILVDYNKNQVGSAMHGFVPQVVVIDGKHRFQSATLRGDSHIMAWVGEDAIVELRAGGQGSGCQGPNCGRKSTGASQAESQQHVRMSKSIKWDRKPVTWKEVDEHTSLSSLPDETREHIHNLPVVSVGGKEPLSKMPIDTKGPYVAQHSSGTYLVNPEGHSYARYVTKLHAMGGGGASGGGGPDPASTTPAPGASLIAKGKKKLDRLDVKKMEAECKADMKSGKFKFKPEMEAKAPPGCESMVMKLKQKYGEDSSSPFKIAWSAHNKGNC